MSERRPDQLDVQIALAINQIRRSANEARKRLGMDPVEYLPVTAETVRQQEDT